MALSQLPEGCRKAMTPQLPNLAGLVLQHLQDTHPCVRSPPPPPRGLGYC